MPRLIMRDQARLDLGILGQVVVDPFGESSEELPDFGFHLAEIGFGRARYFERAIEQIRVEALLAVDFGVAS